MPRSTQRWGPVFFVGKRPAGGLGGKGGSVFVECDGALISLDHLIGQGSVQAERGGDAVGAGYGRAGVDAILRVPPNCLVVDLATDAPLGKLTVPGERILVAAGGDGGCGNGVLWRATRQAQDRCTAPGGGEQLQLRLSMTFATDTGLVRQPTAKEKLLSEEETKAAWRMKLDELSEEKVSAAHTPVPATTLPPVPPTPASRAVASSPVPLPPVVPHRVAPISVAPPPVAPPVASPVAPPVPLPVAPPPGSDEASLVVLGGGAIWYPKNGPARLEPLASDAGDNAPNTPWLSKLDAPRLLQPRISHVATVTSPPAAAAPPHADAPLPATPSPPPPPLPVAPPPAERLVDAAKAAWRAKMEALGADRLNVNVAWVSKLDAPTLHRAAAVPLPPPVSATMDMLPAPTLPSPPVAPPASTPLEEAAKAAWLAKQEAVAIAAKEEAKAAREAEQAAVAVAAAREAEQAAVAKAAREAEQAAVAVAARVAEEAAIVKSALLAKEEVRYTYYLLSSYTCIDFFHFFDFLLMFTTHYLLVTTYCSPLTTYYSLLATCYL